MGCESRTCGNVSCNDYCSRTPFNNHSNAPSKDVSLPPALQRAMAQEAEAGREARAKVISAEGEKSASIALRDAANVLTESSAALQVYFYLCNSFVEIYMSSIFNNYCLEIYSYVIFKHCRALRPKRTRRLFFLCQLNC